MNDREELVSLARAVRERLDGYRRSGAAGVPRGHLRRVSLPLPASPDEPTYTYPLPRPAEALRAAEPAPVWQGAPLADFTPPSPAPPSMRTSAPPAAPSVLVGGAAGLAVIREDLGDCHRCRLADKRKNIVYGAGSPTSPLVFVGEGPGANEDETGVPFVGPAGELLTKMIGAMGFTRDEVYICNVVKCRPPGNRNPEPDEIAACEPFLIRQLGAIAPRVIVALGKFAAQTLLRTDVSISALRGSFHRYQGIALMPTFHPAFLLRDPSAKRDVWDDLKKVIAELDRLGVPHGTAGTRQG